MPRAAMTRGFIGIGRRGPGHGISRVFCGFLLVLSLAFLLLPVAVVLIPCRFALLHSERPNRDRVLRAFIGVASWFAVGTSHREGASGDGDHFKLHRRAGNRFLIGLVDG